MRITITLLLSLLLTAGAAWSHGPAPSNLQPHLYKHAPAELLEPIGDGHLLKGWSPQDEKLIADGLQAADLSEKPVKIEVLRSVGIKCAAVKLQAGDWNTGRFSLSMLHQDAAKVLRVVFDGPARCDHLDLWAAVPWRGEDGQAWHWPVFSISTWRDDYERAKALDPNVRDMLGACSLVRYDPLFLDYVTDMPDRVQHCLTAAFPDFDARPPASLPGTDGLPCEAVRRGLRSSRTVALTFDDGPHPVVLPLILHVLEEQKVRATFFLVGEKILQYPQLFRDLLNAGQEVGNHTYTHRRLTTLSPSVLRCELADTSRLMVQLGAPHCRLMRPPGGDFDAQALDACRDYGLTPVFWTRNTGDWKDRPVRDVVNAALDGVRGGDIILLHEGRPDCIEALQEIIEGLRRKGLRPGCVGDLLPTAPMIKGSAAHVLAELKATHCLVHE